MGRSNDENHLVFPVGIMCRILVSSFFIPRTEKERLDMIADVAEKNCNTDNGGNNYLYKITAAAGVDIEQVRVHHRYLRFVFGVRVSNVSYISLIVCSISSR